MAKTETGAENLQKEAISEDQNKTVTIYYGIFFDGTRNHRQAAMDGEKYRDLVDKKKASKIASGMNENKAKKEVEKEAKKELNYKATFANKKDRTNVARLEPYFDRNSDTYKGTRDW